MKVISVVFYRQSNGKEPVRDWLLSLDKEDRLTIGEDIKTVELGWPIGMPLVRKVDKDLWEVRSNLSDRRIARVLFTVYRNKMVLLHGFVKKSQKIPANELTKATDRRDQVLGGSKS